MGILASGFWLACCVHQVKEMTGKEGEIILFYTVDPEFTVLIVMSLMKYRTFMI